MATSRNALSGAYARLALVGALVLIGALVAASAAQAAVSISRAELSGTQLRIEGQASPNRTITVDGAAPGIHSREPTTNASNRAPAFLGHPFSAVPGATGS
jgi:hypothetical protein